MRYQERERIIQEHIRKGRRQATTHSVIVLAVLGLIAVGITFVVVEAITMAGLG